MTHKDHFRICNQVLIALGGNLTGQMDRSLDQLNQAIREISECGLEVVKTSRMFRTPSFPPGSGPDFVNAAIECASGSSPGAILRQLHAIETRAGRARKKRWGPRVLDLDLLAVGDLVLPDVAVFGNWAALSLEAQMRHAPEELILPHPRLHERAFVLAPLLDIAPDWRHPVLQRTVAEMHAALDPSSLVGIHPL